MVATVMSTEGVFQAWSLVATMWSWMATLGFLAMLQKFIPRESRDSLRRNCRIWFQRLTPYIYCDIQEFENSQANSLYQDVESYISSLRVEGAERLSLCKSRHAKSMTFALAHDQRTFDTFDNAKVEWVHFICGRQRPMYVNSFDFMQSEEKRVYSLQIRRKDKERVLDKYMAHIEAKALELKLATRELLLFTNSSRGRGPWQSVPFKHPANFNTLALDGDLKDKVVSDLEKFAANENYYKRIGKAWKRGYLFYGPPGTGKSSMIAAIANKMRYDVYDLELTEVSSNTELRKLLLSTSNKAVVVIEDIDCSLQLSGQRKKNKKKATVTTGTAGSTATLTTETGSQGKEDSDESSKVTLSGLLNFVDGLWSCCGAERIFIFTTNYVEKLEPALLRAGRMDMHVHLSYCTFSAFKQLAKNYLEISEHEFFEDLEKAFVGSYMTPAEVSEVLILYQAEDVDLVLKKVMAALDEHRVDPATIKPPEKEKEEDEEKEKEEKSKDAEAKPAGDEKAEDASVDKQEVVAEKPEAPSMELSEKVELKEAVIVKDGSEALLKKGGDFKEVFDATKPEKDVWKEVGTQTVDEKSAPVEAVRENL